MFHLIHVRILKNVIVYSKIVCWYITLLVCKWLGKKLTIFLTSQLCETELWQLILNLITSASASYLSLCLWIVCHGEAC